MNHEEFKSMRLLQELALASGKQLRSSQTGYLHYHYGVHDEQPHLSIPTVENFLYVLALLKTRSVDQIQEAKKMLQNLLYFQNPSGNFPIYLHDFPLCKDRMTGVPIALTCYWILKLFSQVLGTELRSQLESSVELLISHSLQMHQERAATYSTAIKIGCAAKMIGNMLENSSIENQGIQILEILQKEENHLAWFSPESIGEMLTGLVIVYPSLKNSPWSHFWNHIESTWHTPTCSYTGPGIKESQQGAEPQITLYDFFMGAYSGTFSKRALQSTPIHLKTILVPNPEEQFIQPSYPVRLTGTIEKSKWMMYQDHHIAYSMIEKGVINSKISVENTFHPLKIIWGNSQQAHTLVCQGKSGEIITFPESSIESPNKITLTFSLEGSPEIEDREKNRDALFYIDLLSGSKFLVEGDKSSTFMLDDQISIPCDNYTFNLKFHLHEGEGRFIGHRMIGNRPSQLNNKHNNRYDAYDWFLFLRTLSRKEKCIIIVSLEIIGTPT